MDVTVLDVYMTVTSNCRLYSDGINRLYKAARLRNLSGKSL